MVSTKKPVKNRTKIQETNVSQTHSIEPYLQVWGWVLLFWSLYRYFLKLPEFVDEFIFKPIVFLGPVLWYVKTIEKRSIDSLGITKRNFFPSIYLGIGLGMLFALDGLFAHYLKYGKIQLNPIQVLKEVGVLQLFVYSLATGITEETLNRGFLFQRVLEKTNSLFKATSLSTVLFVLLHVPILITSLKFQGITLILFFFTNIALGIANSFLFYSTRSLTAPILVHVFWNMTVALFL